MTQYNEIHTTVSVSEVGTHGIKEDPVLLVFFGVQHVVTERATGTEVSNP